MFKMQNDRNYSEGMQNGVGTLEEFVIFVRC